MNEILTFEAGYRKVIDYLISKGFQIIDVAPINESRYLIVKAKPYNCLVTYKREFFNSFGKIFEKEGEHGVGDTLNVSDLKTAIQNNVEHIYITFPDGNIYSISVQDFLVNSHKRTVKEGKEVRSISIHKYKREN